MDLALKEAKKAFLADEVPVGCLIVKNNRVIAKAHNQVETLSDPTAHAEILCIGAAALALENWRLTDTTMYCTLEPCPMCAGAILSARIKKLVIGAPDVRLGACGSWIDLFALKHPFHTVEVVGGVSAEESGALLKEFFAKKRAEKKRMDIDG